jgi:hypothetical protein
VHQAGLNALAEYHLPIRTSRLVRILHVPHASEAQDRQRIGEADRKGAPSSLRRAVKPDGGFCEGVPSPPFARFERLNASGLQSLNGPSDARIELAGDWPLPLDNACPGLTRDKKGIHTTPAMAAGLTDHAWALAEILALVAATAKAAA